MIGPVGRIKSGAAVRAVVGQDYRRAMAAVDPYLLDLADEAATTALARRIAALCRAGDVLALDGDFGTGKTTFARAFIRARCTAEEVPSPTFTLVQVYPAAEGGGAAVYHFDLFRLRTADEAIDLGIEDAFAEGISLIEWPQRLGSLLPPDRLDLAFRFGGSPGSRTLTLSAPGGDFLARLKEAGVV
ncbi:MAG TPA: tRNA (adenosine(37)-N6)-threonylcarbamoyltransferase complex ATPase subunit type 1 TsaE [Candidatus Defluviicoccus seviourii]|nr:tRNA (adenosine(37)-N6)-threonylcarbamoyltransferase complex ATPase subunit type 1 TsaE [Candidatus Defluviicoccus seviourii]